MANDRQERIAAALTLAAEYARAAKRYLDASEAKAVEALALRDEANELKGEGEFALAMAEELARMAAESKDQAHTDDL
jgi:hypothetical protein